MNKEELIDWIDRPPSNHDLDNINYIIYIFKQNEQLKTENQQLKENNLAMQEEMVRTWAKHDKLKSTLEEIREYIEDSGYQMSEGVTYDLLQIIDKESDVK